MDYCNSGLTYACSRRHAFPSTVAALSGCSVQGCRGLLSSHAAVAMDISPTHAARLSLRRGAQLRCAAAHLGRPRDRVPSRAESTRLSSRFALHMCTANGTATATRRQIQQARLPLLLLCSNSAIAIITIIKILPDCQTWSEWHWPLNNCAHGTIASWRLTRHLQLTRLFFQSP